MTGIYKSLQSVVFKVILLLALITISIVIVINAIPFYAGIAQWLHLPQIAHLSMRALLSGYSHLIAYLQLPWINDLHLEHFTLSSNGLHHFAAVKQLILLNEAVAFVTGILAMRGLYNHYRLKSLWQLISIMRYFQWLPFPFICLMAFGFNRFFIWFHRLLFTDQTWIFNPKTDSIIQVLPPEFFLDCFLLFFILFECWVGVILFLGKKELKEGLNERRTRNFGNMESQSKD